MGNSIRGHGLAILIGDGASVTPTCFVEPVGGSVSVTPRYSYERRSGHAASKGMMTQPRDLRTASFETGVSNYLYYDGLLITLKGALGAISTTGPSGSDYTHTVERTLDTAAMTLEVVYSDELANSSTMTGARCQSWSLNFPLNEPATLTTTYVALNYAAETTHTALSDRTDRKIVNTNDCTSLTLNSVDLFAAGVVQSLVINGENAQFERRAFGSAKPNAIFGTSQGTITAALTCHVDSNTYNDYRALHEAGTEVTLVVGFTAATGETMTVTLRGAIVSDPVEPIGADTGPIEVTINLDCRQTVAADAITIVVVNEVASAVAN